MPQGPPAHPQSHLHFGRRLNESIPILNTGMSCASTTNVLQLVRLAPRPAADHDEAVVPLLAFSLMEVVHSRSVTARPRSAPVAAPLALVQHAPGVHALDAQRGPRTPGIRVSHSPYLAEKSLFVPGGSPLAFAALSVVPLITFPAQTVGGLSWTKSRKLKE